MRELPTGTVTFLFSDIEKSTQLLARLGDRYSAVLEDHQRLLREAFGSQGGVEVVTEGDSFFVVFPKASAALLGAVEAQRELAAHPWPQGAQVRVRIGMHSGEGILGGDNYVGIDLHRGARISDAAHGGQILVSEATRGLVAQALPEGVTLRDLGEHRLKDLVQAEHLFQVVVDGLPADFPPIRSLEARPTNLPAQLTSFVGRRREVEEVKELLRRSRLLTLTGPGGTGKTRLSLQVASELLSEFADGVFFVPLAPISDPDLVISTVAMTLGLREEPNRPPIETLAEHVDGRRMLLVLDNFEQVVAGAPRVGELVGGTEALTVLVTSREMLRLHGEQEYPVPPLSLPDVAHLPPLEVLSQYEAVRLFIERGAAVKPGFSVTNENAPAVAEICARLDGLPLAIELAAARVKLLNPQAILSRLDHRLTLLGGGGRDAPTRQQTLRGAIDWSYDLLDEEERRLFARLAVFRGGFTIESAEAVCSPGSELGLDAFDGIASLTNKSLLRQEESARGEPRFLMLETIREYALERLEESPDAVRVHRRHAEFFLDLASRAEPELTGVDQARRLDTLAREHDNLRAAIEWGAGAGELEVAVQVASALWRFWQFRGHLREGRERLQALVDTPEFDALPVELRARALESLGGLVYWMAEWEGARKLYEGSLEANRELGEPSGVARALYNLGFTYSVPRQDIPRAQELWGEAVELFERAGDRAGKGGVLWALADSLYGEGRQDEARRSAQEALAIFRETGNQFMSGWSLHTLGIVELRAGDLAQSRELFTESLRIFAEAGDTSAISLLLADFAALEEKEGQHERAATLASAALATEKRSGSRLATNLTEIEGWRDLFGILDQPTDSPAWQRGAGMSDDEAVAYALEREAESQPRRDGG